MRAFLRYALVLLAGAGAALYLLLDGKGTDGRPSIVFIMADDLGYGELGSYGQKLIRTSHLDRMAREGMRFTQFYSASTVCGPAREALMLGRHTGHVRHTNAEHPMRMDDVTVAEVLKAQGYATAMIGKWGLGLSGTNGEPHLHGFDHWFGYLGHLEAHRHYPEHLWRNGERVPYPGNHIDHGDHYSSDVMMDEAEAFIREHHDAPFFLYLPFTLPHADIIVPPRALEEYLGRFPETRFAGSHYSAQPSPNAATAAMITRLDSYVGRLLALLQELNIDERTVVFFTADNGPVSVGGRSFEFFNGAGPLRGAKRDLYEGGIRVPMIARWPGRIPENAVRDTVWSLVDVKATVSEISGAPTPESDGISVVPTLLGEKQDLSARPLYWAWKGRKLVGPVGEPLSWGEPMFVQAVRRGDWKAVRFDRSEGLELYDLSIDAGEQRDVASGYPAVVEDMRAIMEREHLPMPHGDS